MKKNLIYLFLLVGVLNSINLEAVETRVQRKRRGDTVFCELHGKDKPRFVGPEVLVKELLDLHNLMHELTVRLRMICEVDGTTRMCQKLEIEFAEELKRLVKHGADLCKKDEHGGTVLITAAYHGYSLIVKTLLGYEEVRKTINAKDSAGSTALDYALKAPLLGQEAYKTFYIRVTEIDPDLGCDEIPEEEYPVSKEEEVLAVSPYMDCVDILVANGAK